MWECFGTTSHDGLYPFRRRAERGRNFDSIEDGEPSAGPCPDIDDAPTTADALCRGLDNLRYLRDR